MNKTKSKNIFLIGLGNLGSNYLKAIFSFSFKINLFIHDKNTKLLDQKLIYPKNVKLFKVKNLNKFNKNIDLAILATTAKKRLDLVKILKKSKVQTWILEKLIEQSVSSTNEIYENLKLDSCWVNIPRRAMSEYKYMRRNFQIYKPNYLKLSMNGDRIVTNAIHFIDLLSWFTDSKVRSIDITKLKNKWIESKRKGFYETGGVLKILLENNSQIVLKAGNKVKKSDIIISNKLMSWKISEKNLYACRSDGLKIKIKLPFVSEIMKKVIKDIFKKKTCSLPTLKEVVANHNILINSLKNHWKNCKKKNVTNLPIT